MIYFRTSGEEFPFTVAHRRIFPVYLAAVYLLREVGQAFPNAAIQFEFFPSDGLLVDSSCVGFSGWFSG